MENNESVSFLKNKTPEELYKQGLSLLKKEERIWPSGEISFHPMRDAFPGEEEYAEGMACLEHAAEQGYLKAQMALGGFYGAGVEVSLKGKVHISVNGMRRKERIGIRRLQGKATKERQCIWGIITVTSGMHWDKRRTWRKPSAGISRAKVIVRRPIYLPQQVRWTITQEPSNCIESLLKVERPT